MILRTTAAFLLLLLSQPGIEAQDTAAIQKISLLFIGDVMGHDGQIASALDKETGTYRYDEVFRYIKPVLEEPDVAIANLEVTLAGRPYKGYPQFSSPASLADAGRNAGIDCYVTANNHSADRGKKGIISTIARLDSMGIPHTGTFTDATAREILSPLMIRKKGFTLALLNYTYGTNGIRVPQPVIVDSLDKKRVLADIRKAKGTKPDAVIVYVHWGTEYDTVPGKNQAAMASEFFAAGADLVIGSHPHVIQKMVMKQDSTGRKNVLVYSLGNFVSNQRNPRTDGGCIVKITLSRENDVVTVSEAGYYLTWVYTPAEETGKKFYILPASEFENDTAFFSKKADYNQMKRFIAGSRRLLGSQNEGIGEYVFDAAARRWSIKEN